MYRAPRPYARQVARRTGFTLVELLIVITIIAILAALSVGAAMMPVYTSVMVRCAGVASFSSTMACTLPALPPSARMMRP